MKYNIFVGTHHKTGTHWMLNVFSELARFLEVPFHNISKLDNDAAARQLEKAGLSGRRYVAFHEHSRFPRQALAGDARGLHMIRDPLDVLISAVRYHETTEAEWVHKPQKRFDGRSVQEVINSFDNFQDKLLFEIDHVGERNIRALSDFERGSTFRDVHYEDLIVDTGLNYSAALFDYLGLDYPEIALACCVMWRNSLFGTLRQVKNDHVKDGSARQYVHMYEPETRARFDEKYAPIRKALGYHDERIPGEGAIEMERRHELVDSVLKAIRENKRTEAVAAALSLLVSEKPTYAPGWGLLIREHLDKGDIEEAVKSADAALEAVAEGGQAFLNVASTAYEKAGRLEEATAVLRAGLTRIPRWAHGWTRLHKILRKEGRYDAARQCVEEALRHCPGDSRLASLLEKR